MNNKVVLCTIAHQYIVPGPFQPRQQFADVAIEELAQSIRSAGLLQPLVVRPHPTIAEHYEIVAGERRWRAAKLAELKELPCLVKHYRDDQAAEAATIENVNRVDLNPIEEARAYQQLMTTFDYLQEELALVLGKSRSTICNALRLLKLPEKVQRYLIDGQLTEGHAKCLLSVTDNNRQCALATQTIQHKWSVRRLEKAVKQQDTQPLPTSVEQQQLTWLSKQLGDKIGCRSQIVYHNQKGQVIIDFHDLEVLQGVLMKLGVVDE